MIKYSHSALKYVIIKWLNYIYFFLEGEIFMTKRRRSVFAANWKMNLNAKDAGNFVEDVIPLSKKVDADILIFPPSLYLPALIKQSAKSDLKFGAQNIFWEEEGAYTGEISAYMLKDCGAKYTLVGHSERRHFFGESAEMVTRKARAAQNEGIIPIICVGETLEERENGETMEVLQNDIFCSLSAVDNDENIIIAYEPVWAIGTGLTCPPDQAEEAISYIRTQVRELWGSVADEIRILYGGSVKPSNIAQLMDCPNIDGALIGGASLEAESFISIIKNGIK